MMTDGEKIAAQHGIIEHLRQVANERLATIRDLSESVHSLEKQMELKTSALVYAQQKNDLWEQALWAILEDKARKVLLAEGIPDRAITLHLQDASDCFIEVLESYSEAYVDGTFEDTVISDFWQNVIGYLE